MAAALALLLGLALPGGGSGYCMRAPPAILTRYTYKGVSYPFRLGRGVWNSPQPIAEILSILMTEQMGIEVERPLKVLGGSMQILQAIAGCPSDACTDAEKTAGLFKDPPDSWFAAEVWSTGEEEKRLIKYTDVAGPIGYVSTPSLMTFQRVHDAAEKAGEFVGFWRSLYRPSATAFFSDVATVNAAILGIKIAPNWLVFSFFFGCDGDSQTASNTCWRAGIIQPGKENGAVSTALEAEKSAIGFDSDGWYYSPACRQNKTTCVPVILGSWQWNLKEKCLLAAEQNLPLAITSLGWFGEIVTVNELYTMNLNALFYWWRPDYTFHTMAPRMMFFKEDILRIRQFQYTNKVLWTGVKGLDEDLYSFVLKVSFTDNHLEAMMMERMNGTSNEEVACKWVKSNTATWQFWIPNRENCLRGFFFDAAQQVCRACKAGSVTRDRGMRSCTLCGRGNFSKDDGMTECERCPAGKFASVTGLKDCDLCPRGTYSGALGLVGCQKCPIEKQTTPEKASVTAAVCVCPAGTYKPRLEAACKPCPSNMTCPMGSLEANIPASRAELALAARGPYPTVDPGFYTEYTDTMSVYKCSMGSHCPGGPPESCAGLREGLNCAACPSGYDGTSDGCSECSGMGKVVFLLLAVPLSFGLPLVVYYGSNSPLSTTTSIFTGTSVAFGILITSAQVLGVLSRLRVPWPAKVDAVLRFFSLFLFEGKTIGKHCIVGYDPILVYLFEVIPIFLVLVLFAIYFLLFKLVSRLSKGKVPQWGLDSSLNAAGSFMQVVFISLAGAVFKPLQCYLNPNGTNSNASFPQILCYEGGDHPVLIGLAAPMALLVLLPFMCLSIWAALQVPDESLLSGGETGMLSRFRYLLFRFRPDSWWWGSIFSGRQVLIALGSMVAVDDPRAQIIYFVAILAAYLVALGHMWPWRKLELNMLDAISVLFIIMVLVNVGSFMPPTLELDTHRTVMIVFIVGLFIVIGLAMLFCFYILYFRGFNGFYGFVYPRNKTFVTFAIEWLSLVAFHAKQSEPVVAEWLRSLNDFDRRVIDTVISISQGYSIGGSRKLISSAVPDRLVLDRTGPPVEIPRAKSGRGSFTGMRRSASRLSNRMSARMASIRLSQASAGSLPGTSPTFHSSGAEVSQISCMHVMV